MRPEGALRHLLLNGHWPVWLNVGDVVLSCKPCAFKGGPRRPLPPLRFAWSPARMGA